MAFALFPVGFIASEDWRCGRKVKAVNFFTSVHLAHLISLHPLCTHLKDLSHPEIHCLIQGKCRPHFSRLPQSQRDFLNRWGGEREGARWAGGTAARSTAHIGVTRSWGHSVTWGSLMQLTKTRTVCSEWDNGHWNCRFLLFPQLHTGQQRGTSGQESALITYSESGWIFMLSLNSLGNKKPNNSSSWFPDERLK